MATAKTVVKAYGGIDREITKLAIYAETDQSGQVFYKTEGQDGFNNTAIQFEYDVDKAVDKYIQLVKDVLVNQTKQLELRK